MPFSEIGINKKNLIENDTKGMDYEDQALNKFFQSHKIDQTNISQDQIDKQAIVLQDQIPKLKNIRKETLQSYAKIRLYIDQLAQTKTRAEVTPDEKQFFLDFQSMNQSLGIDYQLPPFKESHETKTVNTMADVYHHTDAVIQYKNA